MHRLCRLLSDYLGLLVLIAAIVAFLGPTPLACIPTSLINPLLGIIMFGMGITLRSEDFRILLKRPKDIVLGSLAQYTLMPLIAYVLCHAFDLDEGLALGVILVGCCPGGTASNVITYLAGGDLALSVGMTAVSTLLAPLLTPLLVLLLSGEVVDVHAGEMMLSIVSVVILPILAGIVVQRVLPGFTQHVRDYLPGVSSLTIAFIVAIVIAHNAITLRQSGWVILVLVVVHNLSGLILGNLAGRLFHLSAKKRCALSIEVGMQNSGLAASLATIHFASMPLAAVPGAVFSVWHNLSGAFVARLYARAFRKRPSSGTGAQP